MPEIGTSRPSSSRAVSPGVSTAIQLALQGGQFDAIWHAIIYFYLVVSKRPRGLDARAEAYVYPLEQFMRRRIAEATVVGEDVEATTGHHATGGGAVEVPHLLERLPDQREVFLGSAAALSVMRVEEPIGAI